MTYLHDFLLRYHQPARTSVNYYVSHRQGSIFQSKHSASWHRLSGTLGLACALHDVLICILYVAEWCDSVFWCVFCCSLQFVFSKLSLGGSEQHRARSVLHQYLFFCHLFVFFCLFHFLCRSHFAFSNLVTVVVYRAILFVLVTITLKIIVGFVIIG